MGHVLARRALWVVAALALLLPAPAGAGERGRGFVDAYGGVAGLLESDVPDARFADAVPVVGGRVGVWLGDRIGLAFRTWYFQSDAKLERSTSPSDLAFLGLSLEALARWPLDERWSVYGSLGPAVAVTTLDFQRIVGGQPVEEDARSVAPGVSAGLGVEARVLPFLAVFAETHASLVYPSFHFSDQRLAPRLLNLYGLVGVRVPF